MNIFSISFKNLTPLFCRGKNSSTAEIRAPSIKGQLRWWFRAWNPKALAQSSDGKWSEGQIMGGTGKLDQPSPFLLRVRPIGKPEKINWNIIKSGIVRGSKNEVGGIQYLGFSFGFQARDAVENECIVSDTKFEALNVFPDRKKCNEEIAKSLIASWWLFCHLGGLGARSRRCFGSLSIDQWRWPEQKELLGMLPLPSQAKSTGQWQNMMVEGLNIIQSWLPSDAKWPDAYLHPHMGVGTSVVMDTFQSWKTPKDAMEYAGQTLARKRKEYKGKSASIDNRVTIGLPLTTGKSRKRSWNPDSYKTNLIKSERSGSALHMSIGSWQNGCGVCWTRIAGPVPGIDMFRVRVEEQNSREYEIRTQAESALDSLVKSLPGKKWSPGDTR